MSIAEKVATQFNAQDASYIGLDGKLCLFRDIVSEAGGVFLRATTPDDEINSVYTNPQGWVFGFSDGSRIAIACGSGPVVLENEGVDYPKEKAQEEERQQKAWLESLPETAHVIYSNGKPFVAKDVHGGLAMHSNSTMAVSVSPESMPKTRTTSFFCLS